MGSRKVRLLAIDPGLNGTAWALFRSGRFINSSTLRSPKDCKWPDSLAWFGSQVRQIANTNHADVVAIEWPEFHQSAGGMVVAKSGSLIKLTSLAGALYGFLNEFPVELVPVRAWRGQVPEAVIKKRIRRRLGDEADRIKTVHEWDAVGIGLYWMGDF